MNSGPVATRGKAERGKQTGAKAVNHLATEENPTPGGEHTMQNTYDILSKYIPETHRALLINVSLIIFNKNKKMSSDILNCPLGGTKAPDENY